MQGRHCALFSLKTQPPSVKTTAKAVRHSLYKEALTVQRGIDVKQSLRNSNLGGISSTPPCSAFNTRLYTCSCTFSISALLLSDGSSYTTTACLAQSQVVFDSPRQDQGAEDSDFNISRCVGAQNAH